MAENPILRWLARAAPAACLAGACLASSLPLRADWLVLRDGSRVETQGSWEVKGKLVVFKRTDGSLASLRATEVDLEGSRRATVDAVEAAKKAAEPPPPERQKKSVASITDKDLPKHAPVPPPVPGDAPAGTPKPASPVVVTEWRKQALASGEGLMIIGTLHNQSSQTVTNINLLVSVADQQGTLLGTAQAQIPTKVLAADGTVEFRATFNGVLDFTGVRFEAAGWGGDAPAAPAAATPPANPNQPPSPPHL